MRLRTRSRAFLSVLTTLLISILLLTGCDNPASEPLMRLSKLNNDNDFQRYEEMKESGELAEDGTFDYKSALAAEEEQGETETVPDGAIHVTFSSNRYLDVDYFSDADLTESVGPAECYMDPGDTIYASDPLSKNPNSNMYSFEEFQVYEYDETGQRGELLFEGKPEGNAVFTIPDDFEGSEISVVPVGDYEERELSLNVYYRDDDGKKHDLSSAGHWEVNGEAQKENEPVSVSPVESYTLAFNYDTDNYFYVGSSPECFNHIDELGKVEFWSAGATDEAVEYSVELHPYLHLTIRFSEDGTVRVNDGEEQEVKKGSSWKSGDLAYGDRIVIESKGKPTITDGDDSYVEQKPAEPIEGGSRYTLDINSSADSAEDEPVDVLREITADFDGDDAHGICVYTREPEGFMAPAEEISGKTIVRVGDRITLKYTLTDDGYEFAEGSGGALGPAHDLFFNRERVVTITIDEKMDGQTISREDYITIKKKGE